MEGKDLMGLFDGKWAAVKNKAAQTKKKAKAAYKKATTPIPFGSGKPSLNENTRKLLKKVDD